MTYFYYSVFDIQRFLLYNSRNRNLQIEQESEDLSIEPAEGVSRPGDGKIRELYSDIHMKYTDEEGAVFFRIENQSDLCNTMPVRDMGYQYTGYQQQVRELADRNRKTKIFPKKLVYVLPDGQKLSPVITMVLNYNKKEWKAPLNLKEMLNIPGRLRDKLKPLINDHSIYVVNLAHQDEETVNKYQSDFRMVVEYLTNPKECLIEKWLKEGRKIRHPLELADLLYALSKDERYRFLSEELSEREVKGEDLKMCELLDILENRGIEKGIRQGVKQGMKQGIE